jgi:hemoglobin-like flavoprotein
MDGTPAYRRSQLAMNTDGPGPGAAAAGGGQGTSEAAATTIPTTPAAVTGAGGGGGAVQGARGSTGAAAMPTVLDAAGDGVDVNAGGDEQAAAAAVVPVERSLNVQHLDGARKSPAASAASAIDRAAAARLPTEANATGAGSGSGAGTGAVVTALQVVAEAEAVDEMEVATVATAGDGDVLAYGGVQPSAGSPLLRHTEVGHAPLLDAGTGATGGVSEPSGSRSATATGPPPALSGTGPSLAVSPIGSPPALSPIGSPPALSRASVATLAAATAGTTATPADRRGSSWHRVGGSSFVGHSNATYSPIVWLYDTFYTRLFAVAPSTRPLFKDSLKVQGRALVRMIDTAVTLLDRGDQLVPSLQALAVRHLAYGALPPHYAVVGQVLLESLRTCLGEELYTPPVEAAWLAVYSVMMEIMMPAAYGPQGARLRAEGGRRGGDDLSTEGSGIAPSGCAAWARAAGGPGGGKAGSCPHPAGRGAAADSSGMYAPRSTSPLARRVPSSQRYLAGHVAELSVAATTDGSGFAASAGAQ